MSVIIRADFLQETKRFFDELPEIATRSASMAINDVASRDALKLLRKDIESQVDFPTGYLSQPDRLGVSRKATPNNLEAVITARDRATSLARFARGQTVANTRGKGVRVQVKPGVTKQLPKAFLVNLRNGNTGLAVRLKDGQSLRNKNDGRVVKLGKNTYLLYGPSVDQVFRDVADGNSSEIGQLVTNEFFRQFARLTRD